MQKLRLIQLDAVEGDSDVSSEGLDRRVLGVREDRRRVSVHVRLERRPDTSGVHDQGASVLTKHLDVGMPAGHDGRALGSELSLEGRARGVGEQVDGIRARGAVKQRQAVAVSQRELEALLEAAYEFQVLAGKPRPILDRERPLSAGTK